MAEQRRDEELNVDFFYSDKVKLSNQDCTDFKLTIDKVLEAMATATLSLSPPELYDLSMVSLKSVQSNFILIG